jgi:hypothetical protein
LLGCGKQKTETTGSATTVFVNGTVLPVDAGFSEHEALAISGNKILAIGSREDVLAAAGRGATTIDLAGRIVLPGFIEPHMHCALLAGLGNPRGCRPVPAAHLHATVFRAPAIVALLCDPQLTADFARRLAAGELDLGFSQHMDNLLGLEVLSPHGRTIRFQ